jgi:phosphoribosylformimino-5-aminoimidazole carboxamide ribotide isomerase
MKGPNIEQTEIIANSVSIPVIASGGISSIKDLQNLKNSKAELNGVISGRAIYDKILKIDEAIKLLRG